MGTLTDAAAKIEKMGKDQKAVMQAHSVDNTSGLEPIGDLILVALLALEKKTSGGIIVVDETARKEALSIQTAQVIRFGDTAKLNPRARAVSEGDLIVFSKYAGSLQTGDDGKEYRLIRPEDLLGKRDRAPTARPTAVMSSTHVFDIVD